MKNQIADKVKDERRDLLLQYQSTISEGLMNEKTGKKYKVLVESRENGYYVGRSQDFTAEIDGEILIESSSRITSYNVCYTKLLRTGMRSILRIVSLFAVVIFIDYSPL